MGRYLKAAHRYPTQYFYPIPSLTTKALQKAFFDYVNFPFKNVTVKQEEMFKLRQDGVTKLINIQAKSEASKVKWLVDVCVQPDLNIHLALIARLLGEQKGKSTGKDLFFTTKNYARKILNIDSPFYEESIKAITTLDTRKQVLQPRDEKIFYNPIFLGRDGHTLNITKPCELAGVFTYGQLLDEVEHRNNDRPHCRHIAKLYDRIEVKDFDEREHHLLTTTTGNFTFQKVTQSLLYAQLIRLQYRDHHSSAKWVEKLRNPVDWDKVWTSVHNPLSTEETTSFIWEQIHLNMYTTHSYNKWHTANMCCPLCTHATGSEYHLIFDCPIVTSLWSQIEPLATQNTPCPRHRTGNDFRHIGELPHHYPTELAYVLFTVL